MFPKDSSYCLVLLPGTWTSFAVRRGLKVVPAPGHLAHPSPGRG